MICFSTKIHVFLFSIISIIRCFCRLFKRIVLTLFFATMHYFAQFVGNPMVYLYLFQSHHTWGARRRLPHLSYQRCAEAEQGEEPGEGQAEAAAAGAAAAERRQGRHWRGRRCRHQTSAVPGRKKIILISFLKLIFCTILTIKPMSTPGPDRRRRGPRRSRPRLPYKLPLRAEGEVPLAAAGPGGVGHAGFPRQAAQE